MDGVGAATNILKYQELQGWPAFRLNRLGRQGASLIPYGDAQAARASELGFSLRNFNSRPYDGPFVFAIDATPIREDNARSWSCRMHRERPLRRVALRTGWSIGHLVAKCKWLAADNYLFS